MEFLRKSESWRLTHPSDEKEDGEEVGKVNGLNEVTPSSSTGNLTTLLRNKVVQINVNAEEESQESMNRQMFGLAPSPRNLKYSPNRIRASPRKYIEKHMRMASLDLEDKLPSETSPPSTCLKRSLLVSGSLLLIAGCIGIYTIFGGGGIGKGNSTSPTASPPPPAPGVLKVPSSLKIILNSDGSEERSSSRAAFRALGRDLKLLNQHFDHLHYSTAKKDVITDISTSRDGQSSFRAATTDVEQIVCALSLTRWDSDAFKPTSRSDPNDYYAVKVDMKQCGMANKGNQTTILEMNVRHTVGSDGMISLDLYVPGWVGRIGTDHHPNRIRQFVAYGRLDQKSGGGFEMNFAMEVLDAGDDNHGMAYLIDSQMDGYLRFVDDGSYYFFSEGKQAHKLEIPGFPAQWDNSTYNRGVSVRGGSALIYNDQAGQSYAYALTRRGDHILIQNCTDACRDLNSNPLNELPLFQSGDDTSGLCFDETSYTEYDSGYCLFSVENGMLFGDDVAFYMNYTREMDPHGSNELNFLQWANPFKVKYYVYPGSGCELVIHRCEQRASPSADWEGGCHPNMIKSAELYNEYEYAVGGLGMGVVSLKKGTTVTVQNKLYNIAPMRSLRVLRQSQLLPGIGCELMRIEPPTWDTISPGSGNLGDHIPTSRPQQMRKPNNYKQICHNAGTYMFSVDTGTQVLATPVFFHPARAC